MMHPGNIISGTNIQFKGFNPTSSIPKMYNTELSSFTTIPKTEYLLNIFDDYKIFMKKFEVSYLKIILLPMVYILCNVHCTYFLVKA